MIMVTVFQMIVVTAASWLQSLRRGEIWVLLILCRYEFQCQYGSIGWSVGATLGSALALQGKKRVISCIGDGSFQVTATVGVYTLLQHLKSALFRLLPCSSTPSAPKRHVFLNMRVFSVDIGEACTSTAPLYRTAVGYFAWTYSLQTLACQGRSWSCSLFWQQPELLARARAGVSLALLPAANALHLRHAALSPQSACPVWGSMFVLDK